MQMFVIVKYSDLVSLLSGVTYLYVSIFKIKLFSMKIMEYTRMVKPFASQLWICLSGFLCKLICARLAFESQMARLADFVVSSIDKKSFAICHSMYCANIGLVRLRNVK